MPQQLTERILVRHGFVGIAQSLHQLVCVWVRVERGKVILEALVQRSDKRDMAVIIEGIF